MHLIPENFRGEISYRINSVRSLMQQDNVDAILIGSNTNIYYLSGRFYRGYVYVDLKNDPLWFPIKPSDFERADNVINIRKPENIVEILKDRNYDIPESIGLEISDFSYNDITRLYKLFPGATMADASKILKKARMIKTPWEIEQMKIDGKHQCNVYAKVKDCYRKGMSDLRLQIEIERELRLEGSLGISRVSGNLMEINLGSVISGENADTPSPYEFTMGGAGVDSSLPVGANNSPINPGETVMIDMNGVFNGYQTDMTRVWCVGEISELAKKAHECSIKILHDFEKNATPGVPVSSLYERAIEIVKDHKLEEFFMGHKNQVGFIGHGVGIELNELPVINAKSKDILQSNMTLAIEPKFVIPHVGAVGIENTYQVTPDGLKNLTVFPEEIQKL